MEEYERPKTLTPHRSTKAKQTPPIWPTGDPVAARFAIRHPGQALFPLSSRKPLAAIRDRIKAGAPTDKASPFRDDGGGDPLARPPDSA
jgi:hypothetical protein